MSDPKYINEMDLRREIRALPDYGELWRTAMKRFLDCVDEVRPADVVEVVRCKDCKHYKTMFCKMDIWHRDITLYRADENDFCSYGERKDG